MSYTTVDYEDVEAVADGMHFLREPLEAETVGVTVLEADPGWSGMSHDHAEEDHEEVYLLLEGRATVIVEDEEVSLEAGEAIRIAPEAERQIENGDTESTFVLVGAP